MTAKFGKFVNKWDQWRLNYERLSMVSMNYTVYTQPKEFRTKKDDVMICVPVNWSQWMPKTVAYGRVLAGKWTLGSEAIAWDAIETN